MKYTAITNEVIKQGIDQFNFDTLPQHLKSEILTEVGDLLFKQNNHKDAGKAFSIAQNEQKLQECAHFLQNQALLIPASYYLLYSNNKEKIEYLAIKLLDLGKTNLAFTLFVKSDNREMMNFIKENY
tara:strand:+ start:749 stop:1129 length:381 start_codon:yes stop_codon:yes gene_type:complete